MPYHRHLRRPCRRGQANMKCMLSRRHLERICRGNAAASQHRDRAGGRRWPILTSAYAFDGAWPCPLGMYLSSIYVMLFAEICGKPRGTSAIICCRRDTLSRSSLRACSVRRTHSRRERGFSSMSPARPGLSRQCALRARNVSGVASTLIIAHYFKSSCTLLRQYAIAFDVKKLLGSAPQWPYLQLHGARASYQRY